MNNIKIFSSNLDVKMQDEFEKLILFFRNSKKSSITNPSMENSKLSITPQAIEQIKNQIIENSKEEIIEIVNQLLEKVFFITSNSKINSYLKKQISKNQINQKLNINSQLKELKTLIQESESFSFELTKMIKKKLSNE